MPSTLDSGLPAEGRIYTIQCEEPRDLLHRIALINHEENVQLFVLSRLSPQRLGQHLNLESIEFRWLTENMNPHAISPSLERIHHAISSRVVSDSGIVWLDAVEYLIHRQGFDAFLAFTRSLADELNGKNWAVLLPFDPLSLDGTEAAQLRREAVPYSFPFIDVQSNPENTVTLVEDIVSNVEELSSEDVALDNDEGITGSDSYTIVKMLSSIAESALSKEVLSRRMMQWISMGFDVSELESALKNPDSRYQIYRRVEEKVRRAVECIRRIEMLEIRGHKLVTVKMRFRVMQLTGLDTIEEQLDELLSGES